MSVSLSTGKPHQAVSRLPDEVPALLNAVRRAARRGDLMTARRLTARLLAHHPACVEAWLWRAWLADTPEERLRAARQAHALAPHDPRTQKALRWASQVQPQETRQALPLSAQEEEQRLWNATSATASRLFGLSVWLARLALVMAVIAIGLVAWTYRPRSPATPTPLETALRRASVAWMVGDYASAANFLADAYRLAPDDETLRLRLAQAHMKAATQALNTGDPDAALPHLEAARALYPEEEAILREYQALQAYLAGREASDAGRWEEAVEALAPLYQLNPSYLDVADRLNRALVALWEVQRRQEAAAARAIREARLAHPGRTAAAVLRQNPIASYPGQAALARVPPLVPPTNKRIVVDISEQRMYVYENGRLKWSWVVSTGEPKRPTVPGEYRVQSKIRNARSNVWRLWMPWWLGIYWVGPIENGIHGLPVSDAGYKMWEGYLGQRVSYGCIILSDENARQLWEWADIGTPVTVRW